MTAHKAWAAAAVALVGPILTWLATWLSSTDQWSWREFASAVIGSVITSLAAGGFTWAVPNRIKTVGEHTAAGVALDHSHPTTTEG